MILRTLYVLGVLEYWSDCVIDVINLAGLHYSTAPTLRNHYNLKSYNIKTTFLWVIVLKSNV